MVCQYKVNRNIGLVFIEILIAAILVATIVHTEKASPANHNLD